MGSEGSARVRRHPSRLDVLKAAHKAAHKVAKQTDPQVPDRRKEVGLMPLSADMLVPRHEHGRVGRPPVPVCALYESRDGRVLGICNWQQTMDGSRNEPVLGHCDGQETMVDFWPSSRVLYENEYLYISDT